MRNQSKLRSVAIILLMIVTALSLTGILPNTYATPLIVLFISVLFFVIAYESIAQNKYASAKRFIIIALILFAGSVILFVIGNF